jgi:hypothetical protein
LRGAAASGEFDPQWRYPLSFLLLGSAADFYCELPFRVLVASANEGEGTQKLIPQRRSG